MEQNNFVKSTISFVILTKHFCYHYKIIWLSETKNSTTKFCWSNKTLCQLYIKQIILLRQPNFCWHYQTVFSVYYIIITWHIQKHVYYYIDQKLHNFHWFLLFWHRVKLTSLLWKIVYYATMQLGSIKLHTRKINFFLRVAHNFFFYFGVKNRFFY